jgi:hypothetical protein
MRLWEDCSMIEIRTAKLEYTLDLFAISKNYTGLNLFRKFG